MAYFDAVYFLASASGTGDFGVASAVQGYRTPAAASVPNAAVGGYRAESSDLTQWEIGVFTYSTTGPTVARTTVLSNSLGTTAKINFTAAPNVGFVELSQDLTNASLLLTGLVDYKLTRAPRGLIWGLTLANNATTPNTVYDISAGESASNDATTPALMVAAAFSKTTGAWAVGSGNGSLDTGSVAASTWYHVFQIMRPDTGVVDYLLSTSATAPTMPANYTHKRRIGSIKTNASSQIIAFKQFEDSFFWAAIVGESPVNSTGEQTLTLAGVPTGIRVQPFLAVNPGLSVSGDCSLRIRSPDLMPSGAAPNIGGVPGGGWVCGIANNVSRVNASPPIALYTNTSAQLTTILAGTMAFFVVNTSGWSDTRGRLS